MLHGKGMFIWQIHRCEGGDAASIVRLARSAGITHLVVKIADGTHAFPGTPAHQLLLQQTINACKAAGITVWGWQFIYGRDPKHPITRTALAEAQIAVSQMQLYGLSGFAIDIENTGHAKFTWHGDITDAQIYAGHLRTNLQNVELALASARFPQYHPNLPWATFADICDVMMPQVYWVDGDPGWNLRASWEAYQARWPDKPYIPIGAAYGEGGWSATPSEITAFLDQAQALGLPAANFWSWQHARYDDANPTWHGTELWDAIANHNCGGIAPSPPQPAQPQPTGKLWISFPHGLKFRNAPTPDNASWVSGYIVPCGTAVKCLGVPTQPDAYGFRFQKVQIRHGQTGWVTHNSATETYLTSDEMHAPPQPGTPSTQMRVTASWGLKFRRHTLLDDAFWIDETVFGPGTILTAIGQPSKVDNHGYRWQYIQVVDGRMGWVGHTIKGEVYLEERALVTHFPVPLAGSPEKHVTVTASLGLKLRSESDTSDAYWLDQIVYAPGESLTAIGQPTEVNFPGPHEYAYRWHYVRDGLGRQGWVIYAINEDVFLLELSNAPVSTVWSNKRAALYANSTNTAPIWHVEGELPLVVLDDPHAAAAAVGIAGTRIQVRTPALKLGYIDGVDVRRGAETDARLPIQATLTGESPYIYGFHDTFDRGMFHGKPQRGWTLITEQLGKNPATAAGNRNTYVDWANNGYGVISRLNYGYDSAGTVPEPHDYPVFAQTCATWVRNSIDPLNPNQGCHIWIIANEMNNPREWPGNNNGSGGQVITPELYASCFNQCYRAIKAVQPNSVIIPGAIDPYNAVAGDTRDYFKRMLDAIDALDGFALHAYTHGHEPSLITSKECFGNYPLEWQYYHFYVYRTFMDMIPAQWREVPVYITETDQVGPWVGHSNGWVQAAYEEIDRWNRTPHHQQIRALLLYRWWSVDQWAVEHNNGVKTDFREALASDYRWRTTNRAADFVTSGASLVPPIPGTDIHFGMGFRQADDLTRIYGIGPKIARAFAQLSITSYEVLAQLTPEQIRKRLRAVGLRGISVRTWPEQARLLMAGDELGFKALLDGLRR